ncbi:hypothetical protein [Corynebacterium kalinowskii]|nr:hypothetical protein [Corynebacterium kalinowskii]
MDLVSEATRRREAAAGQWQQLSGGVSACAMAKSGVSFPAAKLAEGKVAALGELLRALRRPEDAIQETEILRGVRTTWEENLAEAQRTGKSRDWIAYLTGGVDELSELGD